MAEMTDWEAKRWELAELFTPASPIDEQDLFAGRRKEVNLIIDAVLQKGTHAVMYGERGVGKTSLARTFYARIAKRPRTSSVIFQICDPNDSFTSLWRKVFRDLSEGNGNLADSFQGEITPDDVRRALEGFDLTTIPIIILDEFDKLRDAEAKALVAHTIKALSDHAVRATLIVVGVAASVTELISEHESIGRALKQVEMKRMKPEELAEIIDKRLPKVGMSIEDSAKAQIVALSRGLPHYTHLLGQAAATQALTRKSLLVGDADLDQAQKDCVTGVAQPIREQYHSATQSPRAGNIYREVLLACALAEADDLGYFAANAVGAPLSIIMGETYGTERFGPHLKKLCEPDRGEILESMGVPRRYRYRFVEPLMQPYIILRGLADGLIDKETLKRITPNYLQPRLSSAF